MKLQLQLSDNRDGHARTIKKMLPFSAGFWKKVQWLKHSQDLSSPSISNSQPSQPAPTPILKLHRNQQTSLFNVTFHSDRSVISQWWEEKVRPLIIIKKIIKKLTNSNALFPPQLLAPLMVNSWKKMQWLKIKNKNKIKNQANPRNNPHCQWVSIRNSNKQSNVNHLWRIPWISLVFNMFFFWR